MPILAELVILMLFTYAIGLGIGWLLWGRAPTTLHDDHEVPTSQGDI